MDVPKSSLKLFFCSIIVACFKIASFAITPVSVRMRAAVFKLCVTTPPSQIINHDAPLHTIIHTPIFLVIMTNICASLAISPRLQVWKTLTCFASLHVLSKIKK